MWSFNRRGFLSITGLGLLSACGFTPVYRQGSAASSLANQMDISVVEGRFGFELRERLIERYGSADSSARYDLRFELSITQTELVINDEAEITRYNLTGISNYQITSRATGQPVFTDVVKTVTAYSATSATFPTTVAERDANIRLARALADLMVTRLSITAKDWAE